MADESVGIGKTSLDILTLQPPIVMKDRVRLVTRSQHTKDMFDSESATSDNRLPGENLRVHRDAFKKELLVHTASLGGMIAHLPTEGNSYNWNEKDKGTRFIGHLEEQRIRQLPDLIAITHGVVAADVATNLAAPSGCR